MLSVDAGVAHVCLTRPRQRIAARNAMGLPSAEIKAFKPRSGRVD